MPSLPNRSAAEGRLLQWGWLPWAMLGLAHLAAALWVQAHHTHLLDDSVQYHTLAANLLAGHGYSQSYLPPYLPDMQRPPGYPALLTLLGNQAWLVVLVQLALLHLSAALLLRGLRPWVGAAAAWGAALAWLAWPYAVGFSLLQLTEGLFLFAEALLLLALLRGLRGNSPLAWWVLAGAAVALACYTKGLGLALLAGAAGAALFAPVPFVGRLLRCVLVIGIGATLLFPWALRNHNLTGHWQWSGGAGTTLLYGKLPWALPSASRTVAEAYPASAKWAQQQRQTLGLETVWMQADSLRPVQETSHLHPAIAKAAKAELSANALAVTKGHIRAIITQVTGLGYGTWQWLMGQGWLAGALATLQGLLLFGVLLLAGRGVKNHHQHRLIWVLALWVLGLWVAHGALWADGRYRLVADLPLVALAALGWANGLRSFRSR